MRADTRILARADRRKEIHAPDDEILIVAGNTQPFRILHTGCQQSGVITFILEFPGLTDGIAQMDFDAEIFDDIDFGIQLVIRQTIVRNTVTHHTPRMFPLVENFDAMSFLGEVISCRQTGGTATDNSDFLAGRGRFLQFRTDFCTACCNVLHRTDENRFATDSILDTFIFARSGTYQTA